MRPAKYNAAWVGIDGGREGLWRDPIWLDVLKIIHRHTDEKIYDPRSAIYKDLELAYPAEKWRSATREGIFRPLFRDYSHPWTRTGLVDFSEGEFRLTLLGLKAITGAVTKTDILIEMFRNHKEPGAVPGTTEKPFAVLASAF